MGKLLLPSHDRLFTNWIRPIASPRPAHPTHTRPIGYLFGSKSPPYVNSSSPLTRTSLIDGAGG